MSRSNYFGYSYFSGANCFIKLNGIPALETAGISYQVQESTQPIYGYSSRIFDAVAIGQKLITGNLIINFIQPNYLAQTIHLSRSAQNLAIETSGPSVREQLDSYVNGGEFNIRRIGERKAEELSMIKNLENYREYNRATKEFDIVLAKYAKGNQIALEEFEEAVKAAEARDAEQSKRDIEAIRSIKNAKRLTESSDTDEEYGSYNPEGKRDPFKSFGTEGLKTKTPLEIEIEAYRQNYLDIRDRNNESSKAAVNEYFEKYSLKHIEDLKKEYEKAVSFFEASSYDEAVNRNARQLDKHLNDLTKANSSDSANRIIAKITGLEAAANESMSLTTRRQTEDIFEDYTKDIGLLGPFNIDIQFAEEYTITIIDAFLTTRGSMIQIDENAIVEEYSFFARDIKYN